jgi:RNA polymerase sigma factor (sigma-70 family)
MPTMQGGVRLGREFMSEGPGFAELIGRVRMGDQQAAAELLRRYEPVIRRTVRVRLRDARLRRFFDSMDICQSVLTSFFARAAGGQYELGQPEHLVRLLVTMTRNKLIHQIDKHMADCRDHRRVEDGAVEEREIVGSTSTPSQNAMTHELVQEAYRRLTPEERQLLDGRKEGREWSVLAAEMGDSPEALRKKLARAVQRVLRELGLNEVDHE